MGERSEVEQELMDASKFKAKNYPDRQDELAALVRACERMPDAAFDTLSEEAAAWYNKAATAMNDHDDIPDFAGSESDEETSDDTDHEADEAAEDAETAEDEADDDANDDVDEDTDDSEDVNEGSIEEDEADEPKPPKKAKPAKAAKGKRKVDAEVDQSTEQLDDEEVPKKGRGRLKKAKAEVEEPAPESEDADDSDNNPPKLKRPKAPTNKGRTRTPYDNLTGEKDRFGLYIGTKTQQAAELYARPEGATSKYVEMELAGRHRNILVRLAKDGHRVEKHEGGVYKLIHRDDLGKEPAKAKKAKK